MTLQESWDGCIKMWEWIVENVGVDSQVYELKIKYVAKNDLTIANDCFFCEYVLPETCDECPGRLVDPNFRCMAPTYSYDTKPVEFLEKIKELNERRMI